MHRFIIESRDGDRAILGADDSKHLANVLRLREGDAIELLDGSGGLFSARIARVSSRECEAVITNELPSREPGVRLTLYQGLPKLDKMDLIVQKATELGVYRVVPVVMERSVAQGAKCERLNKIAREAAKQCGRALIPRIEAETPFSEAAREMNARELMIVPWEEARDTRINEVFLEAPDARDIGLLIGPEGGITPGETASLRAKQITLGPRILRAETAAITSISIIMNLWGDV